jgi:hypothetical protein
MKIVSSVLLFLFSIVAMASAEVIDVTIKGRDDGVRTSAQQDFQEAVMNAKLQAIERAGASIASITQVVNFQLRYDAIESKSKAILLPGFQIMDIGYLADGTYQVILTGKIQTSEQATPSGWQQPSATVREQRPTVTGPRETARDGRFVAYDDGTVLDTSTKLMWAAKDNGSNINWANAKSYCENYRGGGYTDWRMPTQNELAGLYDKAKTYQSVCTGLFHTWDLHLTELIRVTCTWVWASVPWGSEAAIFDFNGGPRSSLDQRDANFYVRALPVRLGK